MEKENKIMTNLEKKLVNGVKEIAEEARDLEVVAETVAVGTYKVIEEKRYQKAC